MLGAKMLRVENMVSEKSGREVPNQFIIYTDKGIYFQSYDSVIAFESKDGKVYLDAKNWNYSKTTAKYRNQFLGKDTKEIKEDIEKGLIILTDLNRIE